MLKEGTAEAEKEPREPPAVLKSYTVMVIKTVLHTQPTINAITEGELSRVEDGDESWASREHGERKW